MNEEKKKEKKPTAVPDYAQPAAVNTYSVRRRGGRGRHMNKSSHLELTQATTHVVVVPLDLLSSSTISTVSILASSETAYLKRVVRNESIGVY